MNTFQNFTFKDRFDKYYLYTEFDVILNEAFYEKLLQFVKSTGHQNLVIEIADSEKPLPFKKEYELRSPTINSLESFYDITGEFEGNNIPIHYIDHFIRDDGHDWEIYVSGKNELAIFGCNDNVGTIFKNVFAPYEDESLAVKFRVIGGMFKEGPAKTKFLDDLDKNFNFSKTAKLI
jgi:hypothetical protein